MKSNTQIGRRLLASEIDRVAKDTPDRIWASSPINNDNISSGYRDITYQEFANAINHASHWLNNTLEHGEGPFETIAYAGPKDLRYPIIAVAALKCGKKILMCSPFASAAAQTHLLRTTKCTTYLHAASFASLVHTILGTESIVQQVDVPELGEWLSSEPSKPFPYDKSWEEAQSDPWLIFHTSGTTGLPKPIIYTNFMMTSFDAAELMPDAKEGETMNTLWGNQRFYVSLPSLHFVGMTSALQLTVFLNMVLVMGPPGQVTPRQIIDCLVYGKAEGVTMPPSQIEDVAREPGGLEALRGLNCVYFAGAPLPRHTAEKLLGHCKVFPAMGSTEAGAYFLKVRMEGDDWEYYCFRPSMGVELEKRTDDLYEVIFHRQAELERWQQLFKVYPHLDKFPTSDLWTPHPTRPDLWRYAGRTDDLIILSHGEGLYATGIESAIQKCPDIRYAVLGGDRKPKPFVLIDLKEPSNLSERERSAKLESIWPYLEQANNLVSDYVKMSKERVLFTKPSRPLPLSAKDTVMRRAALELYQSEIDALYS